MVRLPTSEKDENSSGGIVSLADCGHRVLITCSLEQGQAQYAPSSACGCSCSKAQIPSFAGPCPGSAGEHVMESSSDSVHPRRAPRVSEISACTAQSAGVHWTEQVVLNSTHVALTVQYATCVELHTTCSVQCTPSDCAVHAETPAALAYDILLLPTVS